MSHNIKPSTKIHTINDAIRLSKKRLPKLVFDFIDGASGDDKLAESNSFALDQIRLEPKVFRNVEKRILSKKFFDFNFDYPFGFAPMGMTNLSWPEADKMIAIESSYNNIPTCVSMASSTTLEDMFNFSEGRSWMQIYIFQSEEFIMELLNRAQNIGLLIAESRDHIPLRIEVKPSLANLLVWKVIYEADEKYYVDAIKNII